MEEKYIQQSKFYLDNEWRDYVETVRFERKLKTKTASMIAILEEHKRLSNNNFDLNFIINRVVSELKSEISNVISDIVSEELKRVRMGTNNADRNTQVLIELVQGGMVATNNEVITTTDEYKPAFLNQVEKVVQKRISDLVQKKYE